MNKRLMFLTSILIFTIALILFSQNGVFAAEITNIEINGFTEPIVGMTPDFTATVAENANYTFQFVEWWKEVGGPLEENDKFEKDVNYTYMIYIKAKDGYTFTDTTTATIDGIPLTLDRIPSPNLTSIVFTLDCGKAKELPIVSNIEIRGVKMPVKGEKPEYGGAIPADVNYHLFDEFWYDDETELELTEKFEEGKSYTYYCLIRPVNNAIFSSDVKATIDDKEMKFESNEGDFIVFSYNYKIEKPEEDLNKNETTINEKDDTPKTGASLINKDVQPYIAIIILLSVTFVTKKLRKNK